MAIRPLLLNQIIALSARGSLSTMCGALTIIGATERAIVTGIPNKSSGSPINSQSIPNHSSAGIPKKFSGDPQSLYFSIFFVRGKRKFVTFKGRTQTTKLPKPGPSLVCLNWEGREQEEGMTQVYDQTRISPGRSKEKNVDPYFWGGSKHKTHLTQGILQTFLITSFSLHVHCLCKDPRRGA